MPYSKATKRTLDSAEQEILALYEGLKSSKKLKIDEASKEEDEEAIDDPAAVFGDTDSENDEPVFLEGKAGDEEGDSETEGIPESEPRNSAEVRHFRKSFGISATLY